MKKLCNSTHKNQSPYFDLNLATLLLEVDSLGTSGPQNAGAIFTNLVQMTCSCASTQVYTSTMDVFHSISMKTLQTEFYFEEDQREPNLMETVCTDCVWVVEKHYISVSCVVAYNSTMTWSTFNVHPFLHPSAFCSGPGHRGSSLSRKADNLPTWLNSTQLESTLLSFLLFFHYN